MDFELTIVILIVASFGLMIGVGLIGLTGRF